MVSYSHFGIEGSNGQSRREGRRAWRLGAGLVCGLALGLLAASWVEARPGLVVQPTRVDVDEEDAEGSTYTVALREQPSEDVTVTVVGAEGTATHGGAVATDVHGGRLGRRPGQ